MCICPAGNLYPFSFIKYSGNGQRNLSWLKFVVFHTIAQPLDLRALNLKGYFPQEFEAQNLSSQSYQPIRL